MSCLLKLLIFFCPINLIINSYFHYNRKLYDSKEVDVEALKIKESIGMVVVYCHLHHSKKQQSLR
jgi:hypothetical protein